MSDPKAPGGDEAPVSDLPQGLPMPPNTAATNALMPGMMPMSGSIEL